MIYDDAGNLRWLTDANVATTTYAYDDAGNLRRLTDGEGNATTWAG